ncbi:hypothetical protein [Antarctobacter sp.]|uniref:hypothetical protein n=1 Tax=Antarctobacter sp. TaxID=1872577 RepID=UPI002B26B9D2|nr:hypothetical protein [Antarctobacter sp.]
MVEEAEAIGKKVISEMVVEIRRIVWHLAIPHDEGTGAAASDQITAEARRCCGFDC